MYVSSTFLGHDLLPLVLILYQCLNCKFIWRYTLSENFGSQVLSYLMISWLYCVGFCNNYLYIGHSMQELGKPQGAWILSVATWCQINRCSVHRMTLTDHFIGLNNCTDCSVNCVIWYSGLISRGENFEVFCGFCSILEILTTKIFRHSCWNGAFKAYLVYNISTKSFYYSIHENFPLKINPLYGICIRHS